MTFFNRIAYHKVHIAQIILVTYLGKFLVRNNPFAIKHSKLVRYVLSVTFVYRFALYILEIGFPLFEHFVANRLVQGIVRTNAVAHAIALLFQLFARFVHRKAVRRRQKLILPWFTFHKGIHKFVLTGREQ